MDDPTAASRFGGKVLDVRGLPRLAAVGDVQGNFGALMATLESSGYAAWSEGRVEWRGGDSGLLFIGDLIDKGTEPAEVLVAVASLASGAAAAGGRVILVTGNHDDVMLKSLDATGETRDWAQRQWFANGGLETLARLAHFEGRSVSEELLGLTYTACFSDLGPIEDEIDSLCEFVAEAMSGELNLLRSSMRPVALVNDSVLAFHGAPNFGAEGLGGFIRDEADERHVLWDRGWLSRAGTQLPSQVARLKQRLDDPSLGVSIRSILFGHTKVDALEVPGYSGKQFRIGQVVAPDLPAGVPALYSLITTPREVPPGGAIGLLEITGDAAWARYSHDLDGGGRTWPCLERVGDGDPAFC